MRGEIVARFKGLKIIDSLGCVLVFNVFAWIFFKPNYANGIKYNDGWSSNLSFFSKIQAVALYDTNNMLFCIFNRNNIYIS